MALNYTIKHARFAVDPVAKYGYWERKDGTEGGGLWFADTDNHCGVGVGKGLELTDYDGAYELPKLIVSELRSLGFVVGPEFDAE